MSLRERIVDERNKRKCCKMTVLAVIGGAVGWHRCVKELFDSVVEPANEAQTTLWIESTVNTKHA